MAFAIKTPTDAATINTLLSILVKERPVNMGESKEKIYGLTKDENGNLRIPFALSRLLWNIPLPDYTQLPRKQFACNIALGYQGKDFQVPIYAEMVKILLETRTVYAALSCSSGKTMLAVKLMAELGLKSAIVTDATLIFPQWVKVIQECTNMKVCEVKSPVDKLPEADIYVFMVGAAGKMHPSILEPIKCLCIDEALYLLTPTRIPALLNFTPVYSIGLCAEIKRDDGLHAFIPLFWGSNIIKRISDTPFTVYRVETPYKPTVQYQRRTGKVDWNLVLESISDNEERNKDIIAMCRSLPDSKIIIGCKRVEQATWLHNKLIELGEVSALLVRNAKKFPQCRILVGIYSKMGKGVDVKNLCPDWEGDVFDVAILAADICKPEQFVGRVFRHKNPVIYHLVDDYSTFRKHFERDCCPWYVSRQGQIQNIAITQFRGK
jgi:hypothetical protein